MPKAHSPFVIALRYGVSALGHAMYWFAFLQVAFVYGSVDLLRMDRADSASVLTSAFWIMAGIAILAGLMLVARRLRAAGRRPDLPHSSIRR